MKMNSDPYCEYVHEDAVHPELKCSICLHALRDAVEDNCSPTNHNFCHACIHSWLSGKHGDARGDAAASKTCPQSRQPLTLADLRPNNLARRMTNELLVFCSERDQGCKWQGRRDNLNDHLQLHCSFFPLKCPGHDVGLGPAIPGCNKTLRRGQLKSHTESCPFVLMKPMFAAVSQQMERLHERNKLLKSRVVMLEEAVDDTILGKRKRGSTLPAGASQELLELDRTAGQKKTIIHVTAKLVGDETILSACLSDGVVLLPPRLTDDIVSKTGFALGKTTRLGKLMDSFASKIPEFSGSSLAGVDLNKAEYW